MRVTLVTLATLAGIGLSTVGEAFADAQNLSCISDETILERRVIRDCGKDGQPIAEPTPEVIPPPPPPPPILLMHDGGRKAGDGASRDHEKKSGGGSPGGSARGSAGATAN